MANHLLFDLPGIEKDENTSNALVLIDTDGCDGCEEMVISGDDSFGDEESKANDGEGKFKPFWNNLSV